MYETYWLLPAMVLATGSKPAQKVGDSVAEGKNSKSSSSKNTKSGKELRAAKNTLSEDSPPNKRRLSLQLDTAIARCPGLKAVQPKSGPAAQLNSSSQRGLNARILTARRRRCPKPGLRLTHKYASTNALLTRTPSAHNSVTIQHDCDL